MSETRPLLGSTKGKDNVSGFFWVSVVVSVCSSLLPVCHLPRAALHTRGAELSGALRLHR